MSKLKASRVILVALASFACACRGDKAVLVAPLPGDAGVPQRTDQGAGAALVHPLHREGAADRDISWGFDAGPEGVVTQQQSMGLIISIPKGALSAPVHITVTALHGTHFGYRFEPHGLQFAAPVSLTQSIHGLKVPRDVFGVPHLVGGYFPDDVMTTDATGMARVDELLPVWFDNGRKTVKLDIRHFSGYTVASAILDPLERLP